MSRFTLPLQGIDTNGGYSAGDVVLAQSLKLVFGDDGVVKTVGRLPRPYRILNVTIDTTTAFNAATATLDLGITGDATKFAAALSIKAAGRILASSVAGKLAGASDDADGKGSDLIAKLTAAGGTAGEAVLVISYICPRQMSV